MLKIGTMTAGESAESLVVVVDDDPRLCRLVQLILVTAGYRVDVAERGRDGLELILARRPAVVVLDLNLPDMDGETVHRLAKEAGHQGCYIVLSADIAVGLKSARMGVAYIQKPFDPNHLLDLISGLTALSASGVTNAT